MYKPIVFNKGMENDLKDIRLPFKAEIHNNIIDPRIGKSSGKRILNIVCECPPFRADNRTIINRSHEFDLILTHDENVLVQCGNAKKMLFGTSWINPEDRTKTWENKSYGVSFICGSKDRTEGHKLRHEVWAKKNDINIPTIFWASSCRPINSNGLFVLPKETNGKRLVFDQQFHIVIENTRVKNYFTEKLIDCFMTKTIPIYWGCPNIGDYFDENGILMISDDKEIIPMCNILAKDYYENFKGAIEKNYQLALQYARPFGIRLQEKIIEELA